MDTTIYADYGLLKDHYKPVIENETRTEWESLIARIKEEFVKYPLEVGWNLTDRRPSNASQGNVLEAVNVVLNIQQFHFLDRDLYRTGNSIVVVSPGCGVFEVDKGLAGITYQRMMDNGIGSDMLSLGLPPLHIAPFFLYNVSHTSFRNLPFVQTFLTVNASLTRMNSETLNRKVSTTAKPTMKCHTGCIYHS